MSKFILDNQKLKIEIAKIGSSYQGSRFDWFGIITQITLENEISFCVLEQYEDGKGTGGIGLMNEFGIDQPIGYDDCIVGERFMKLGTGLLLKEEGKYDFFKPYNCMPAEYEKSFIEDTKYEITYTQTSDKGYGYNLTKTISIEGYKLKINYELINTGKHEIVTNEYNHNFIGINKANVSKDYSVTFPRAKTIECLAGEFIVKDKKITWDKTPKEEFYALIDLGKNNNFPNWEIYNEKINAGIRDISAFDISKCAFWGDAHVISPEIFIQINLAPQEAMSWEREYEFFRMST